MVVNTKRKNTFLAHLGLFLENTKLSLLSAMEYKFNFIMQTVGMFVNDIFWLLLWWLLFTRFEAINDWVFKDMLVLYSIATVSFGVSTAFFYGARRLYKTIAEGRLDYYLALPKNVLFHSSLRTSYSACGDILFGLMLVPFSISLSQVPLYVYFVICGSVLFTAITIIFNSLAFYIGNAERARQTGDEAFMSFAMYPFSAFGGATKFFLLTIFPAGFVTGIPVEVMREFNWMWFSLTGIVAFLFLGIAIVLFYKGLKRYESGNLMYAKD